MSENKQQKTASASASFLKRCVRYRCECIVNEEDVVKCDGCLWQDNYSGCSLHNLPPDKKRNVCDDYEFDEKLL